MASCEAPIIYLTAAEASGDMHAANLIRALQAKLPDARFAGVGGPRMADAGCELLEDIIANAGMLLDVIHTIPYYRRIIRQVTSEIGRLHPSVLVPVDSPGLNWHMAAGARKHGVPVMYYIAPQVWAWAPWRIHKVRRRTDHVACLLPFEQEYFRSRGVNATFVGHPMFDHMPPRTGSYPPPPTDGAWRVALLPGSRSKEIHRHAPAMVEAAGQIRRQFPKAEFTFTVVDPRCADLVGEAVGSSLPVVTGDTCSVLADSHFALATSGTVTLEAAYLGVPMVTFYWVSPLGHALMSWWLTRTRYYSLVNIVAGREMVPELIPWYGNPGRLAEAVVGQLRQPEHLAETSAALIELAETLRSTGSQSASAATADLVIQTMR